MPYRPDQRKYDQYVFLRWWCQNQWWVQIAVPCIICAGVISALMYHWNTERQQKINDEIVNAQFDHWKKHPPVLDPDLDEKAAAWRVIRMKQNDPEMPIPYKKKQLIVKHWKEIIVDMKAEDIQRLHDLLQDKPVSPADDISLDIRKFDAPWKDEVNLDDMEEKEGSEKIAPMKEDLPSKIDKENTSPDDEHTTSETQTSDNQQLPAVEPIEDSTPAPSVTNAEITTTNESVALPSLSESNVPENGALPILDGNENADNSTSIELPGLEATPAVESEQNVAPQVAPKPAENNSVGPLEDNYLILMEQEKQKRDEERQKRIEDRKKHFDPDNYMPSSWKDKNLVI